MPYKYRSLDHKSGEIRLLSIPIGPECIKDPPVEPPCCSVEYVASRFGFPFAESHSVEDAPWGAYYALSYEWGVKEPKRSILLDGEPFDITPNLFGALRRVQQAAYNEKKTCIKLWVDAICIDQSNVGERNVQVSRMGHIYSFADIVYCYMTPYSLSPNSLSEQHISLDYDTDVDIAAESIFEISKRQFSTTKEILELLEASRDAITPAAWYTVTRFMSNTYWSRLWIVQEVVLASKRAIVLAGRNMLDFESVGHAGYIMHEGITIILDQLHRELGTLEHASINGFINVAGISWHRINRLRRKAKLDSLNRDNDLVAPGLAPTLLCTDPRDRVYGILGMLAPDQAAKVSVDYQKTVEEVYTNFAAAVIEHTESLAMLWRCSHAYNTEQALASWVLDHREAAGAVPIYNFHVSSLMVNLSKPRIISSALLVPGLCLDHVDGVGAAKPSEQLRSHPQTPQGIVQGNNELSHKYGDFNGLKTAFWSTLHLEQKQDMEKPFSFSRAQLQAMCPTSSNARQLQQLFDLNKRFLISGHPIESFLDNEPRLINGTLEPTASLNGKFQGMKDWPVHRRLTVTQGGRVGWVPEDARKGDAIFVLRGSGPLALLRKHNDAWRCVGDCYVYGLMDGNCSAIAERLHEVDEITIV